MIVVHGRAGVQARVRGEGAGAGQGLAQSCVRGDEISLRFPPTSLYLQVINGLASDTLRRRGGSGELNKYNPGLGFGWGGEGRGGKY